MFMATYLKVVLERMWRVLTLHPEFQELPAGSQLQVGTIDSFKRDLKLTHQGSFKRNL